MQEAHFASEGKCWRCLSECWMHVWMDGFWMHQEVSRRTWGLSCNLLSEALVRFSADENKDEGRGCIQVVLVFLKVHLLWSSEKEMNRNELWSIATVQGSIYYLLY